jgi:hypothetical protein
MSLYFEKVHQEIHNDLTIGNLVLLAELQVSAVLVVRQPRQGNLAPKVRGEERIRFGDLDR